MLIPRVIPVLTILNKKLVKTKKFKNPVYIGDPINALRIFNKKEVDEVIIIDISKKAKEQGPDFEFIKNLASEAFMPLCYGGGITSINQSELILKLGVEKICFNTSCFKNSRLVSEASNIFGAQSIVCSVDIKKNLFGKYKVYNNKIHVSNKLDFLRHIRDIEALGAGEILVNSVDSDGMMNGFDLNLISLCSKSCSVPMVSLGGAGMLEDIKKALLAGSSAVGASSIFIYQGVHNAVLITYPSRDRLESITCLDKPT